MEKKISLVRLAGGEHRLGVVTFSDAPRPQNSHMLPFKPSFYCGNRNSDKFSLLAEISYSELSQIAKESKRLLWFLDNNKDLAKSEPGWTSKEWKEENKDIVDKNWLD